MAININGLGIDSSVEEINLFIKETIKDVPAISYDGNSMNAVTDNTPHKMQYAIGLLNYKGAELNAKATNRLSCATWVLAFFTVVLALSTVVQLIYYFKIK